jgi:hypothetical protein
MVRLTFGRSTGFVVLALVACQGTEDGPAFIPEGVACQECRIEVKPLVGIAVPAEGAGLLPLGIRQDALARYWLLRGGGVPLVFDSAGSYLGTPGPRGRGPGEYLFPTEIFAVGDTVILLDGSNGRATGVNAELAVARTWRLATTVGAAGVISWPDSVLVFAHGPDRPGIRWASFRDLDVELRPFGALAQVDAPLAGQMLSSPRIAPLATGRFWLAWSSEPKLELWSLGGTVERTLARRPAWFTEGAYLNYNWRRDPPPSSIQAISVDRQGLIWIFVRVARDSWSEGWVESSPNAPEARPVPDLLYKAVIEVIDPSRGQVLARKAFDEYVLGVLPGQRVAFYNGSIGGGRISLARVELLR